MKKQLIVLSAAAMVAAAAVPALAFENEFHGMYRAYGYMTNAYSGAATSATGTAAVVADSTQPGATSGTVGTAGPGVFLSSPQRTSSYVEQRARLQYIAKASDDLKLVTHFELDALFGGGSATKYQGNDAGGLDADQVTLETKNVYLDFNIPSAPVNVKIGIQPYSDAYQGVFGNFDGAGVVATGKFGMVTPSLGWFRVAEDLGANTAGRFYPGKNSTDLFTANVKAAISKDITLGASYYWLGKDTPTATSSAALPSADETHTLGVDVAAKVGPAALTAFGAYQFGDFTPTRDLAAYALGAVAKINVGVGNVNVAGVYLSGEKNAAGTDDFGGWQQLSSSGATSYFGASNMWLLIRNNATINTSSAIGGVDLAKGGRGLMGLFAGFDGKAGKLFYAANLGYAQVAEERGSEKGDVGTELNATVGYKLYDNLAVSMTGAYAFLGDGMNDTTAANRLPGGAADAKDPYMTNIAINYTF